MLLQNIENKKLSEPYNSMVMKIFTFIPVLFLC